MTRTLHFQIKSTDRNGLKERLEAIDAGNDVEPSEPARRPTKSQVCGCDQCDGDGHGGVPPR
ncbi:MAG: hypothetical protein RI568_15750, partial [Natronomonas sp.]|nr:hypothetical protein [Natronomonas sp.]